MIEATADHNVTVSEFTGATHNAFIHITNPAGDSKRIFRISTQQPGSWREGDRLLSLWPYMTGQQSATPNGDWFTFGSLKDGQVSVFKAVRTGLRPRPATAFERNHSNGKRGRRIWTDYARMIEDPQRYVAKGYRYEIIGRCRKCNAPLTNPESRRLGIGPVCLQKEKG